MPKISQLPIATVVNGVDLTVIVQGGVTKQVTETLVQTFISGNILIAESQVINLVSDLAARLLISNNLSELTPTAATARTNLGLSAAATITLPVSVANGGTGLSATVANQLLYSSSTSVIGGLATANNGVLITSAGGVPSISSTLPAAVQGNITTLGTQAQALNMGGFAINNVTNPVNAQDAATKNYVDSVATGGGAPVYAATTANLTATQAGAGVGATLTNSGTQLAFAIDGVSPPLLSRILVKNQSASANNGVYILTVVGTGATNWVLTRATDYDTPSDINNTGIIPVENGTANANLGFINTTLMVAVDTTAITFVQFGSTGKTPCAVSVTTPGVSNITGDGTLYTANYATIIENLGSNFTSGTTFTAPTTGRYLATFIMELGNLSSSYVDCQTYLENTTQSTFYTLFRMTPANINSSGTIRVSGATILNLNAGDVVQQFITVTGSTKTINWGSASRLTITQFL
jgi:hypothetical protein